MVRGSIIEGSGGSRFGNFRFVPSLIMMKSGITQMELELEVGI